jgi:hypothetical protein
MKIEAPRITTPKLFKAQKEFTEDMQFCIRKVVSGMNNAAAWDCPAIESLVAQSTGTSVDQCALCIRFHFKRLSPTNFGRNQTPPPTARESTPFIKEENTAMNNCTLVSH